MIKSTYMKKLFFIFLEKVYKEIESILNELCDKLISAKKVEEDW